MTDDERIKKDNEEFAKSSFGCLSFVMGCLGVWGLYTGLKDLSPWTLYTLPFWGPVVALGWAEFMYWAFVPKEES